MLAATDPSTVAALRHFAEVKRKPEWMDTALFLEFIYTWFTILNVRKPGQENRYVNCAVVESVCLIKSFICSYHFNLYTTV